MNAATYPALVCSGVFSPDATVNATQQTIRVMTYTVWEFVTKFTMFDTEKCLGSQAMVDMAMNAIKAQSPVTANGKHLDAIKRWLAAGARFVSDNRGWIVPMATTIGSLL